MRLVPTVILFLALMLGAESFAVEENFSEQPATPYYNRPTSNMRVKEDFAEYMDNVQTRLHLNWRPPDFLEEGQVRVFFKIDRNGNIISANILESSGNDLYDASALEAIRKSAPFGEFPEQTAREYIAINYLFDTVMIEESRMKGYYDMAKRFSHSEPEKALGFLNLAIEQVGGEEASYFLYKHRSEIKYALGDIEGAQKDFETYSAYCKNANVKRVHLLKYLSELDKSSYNYFYLAYAYEQINDYENAIKALDIAIEMDNLDFSGKLKLYKTGLIRKAQTYRENEVRPHTETDKTAIEEDKNT